MESPLATEQVAAKARDLMAPVLGNAKTESLNQRVNELERLRSLRELVTLLTVE